MFSRPRLQKTTLCIDVLFFSVLVYSVSGCASGIQCEADTDCGSCKRCDKGNCVVVEKCTNDEISEGMESGDTNSDKDIAKDTDTVVPRDTATDTKTDSSDDLDGSDGGAGSDSNEDDTEIPVKPGTADDCCSIACVDCSARGHICEKEKCVPRRCNGDEDCAKMFVCNDAWGYCVVASCEGQPDMTRCDVVTEPYMDRAFDICINGACVSPGCGDETCNVPGLYFPLPDTNQRNCYDDMEIAPCVRYGDFSGQDAQFGWDNSFEAVKRFSRIVSSAPVVVDNVTGLMWQGCEAGLSGEDCNVGGRANYNWKDALQLCENLNWGNYTDWRLPDKFALNSLADAGQTMPSLDTDAFLGVEDEAFLSSSSATSGTVWLFQSYSGCMEVVEKSYPYAVRCVRSDEEATPQLLRKKQNDDPIVEDKIAGLLWQGCVAGLEGPACDIGEAEIYTWKDALNYCNQLRWGDMTGWRLPNKNELHSVTNTKVYTEMANAEMFPNTPEHWLWSSTTFVDGPEMAWAVHATFGSVVHFNLKTEASSYNEMDDYTFLYYVRCVRDK